MEMTTQKDQVRNTQDSEITPRELTTTELNGVSGGLRNNQTEWWAAVQRGMDMGQIMAGGQPVCWF
jgi:hypothetical protein